MVVAPATPDAVAMRACAAAPATRMRTTALRKSQGQAGQGAVNLYSTTVRDVNTTAPICIIKIVATNAGAAARGDVSACSKERRGQSCGPPVDSRTAVLLPSDPPRRRRVRRR